MKPGGLISQTVRRPVSLDAVVVIPGIMGSALRERERELRGLQKLGWYGRAQSKRSSTDDRVSARGCRASFS